MNQSLKPMWSKEEQAAGERFRQAWEEMFAAPEAAAVPTAQPLLQRAGEGRLAEVRARHEAELLRYPNVVGVDEGVRMKQGRPTGDRCLVVFVERKVPRSQLRKGELLPGEIEGIPVDVVPIGRVEALPR